MEQNQFEGLEEIETENNYIPEENTKKEYEKLLGYERSREDYEKAVNLVKFGCFKQEQKPTVDFSKLEKVNSEKKYKKSYDLFRNLETMELVFVLPLIENNKGDKDERKDLKPYAYDVITTEAMDNETYLMVCKAAKNNLRNPLLIAYKGGVIAYCIALVICLYVLVYNFVAYISGNDFFSSLALALFYSSTYIVGLIIATFVLVIAKVKLEKYKEQ